MPVGRLRSFQNGKFCRDSVRLCGCDQFTSFETLTLMRRHVDSWISLWPGRNACDGCEPSEWQCLAFNPCKEHQKATSTNVLVEVKPGTTMHNTHTAMTYAVWWSYHLEVWYWTKSARLIVWLWHHPFEFTQKAGMLVGGGGSGGMYRSPSFVATPKKTWLLPT